MADFESAKQVMQLLYNIGVVRITKTSNNNL